MEIKFLEIDLEKDLIAIETVAKKSFSVTPDATLAEWFNFDYMVKMIKEDRGLCLKAVADNNDIAGMIFALQESPINGKEGVEKWVIIIAGVDPKYTNQGIGTLLFQKLEELVKVRGVKKMFTYTNKDDIKVINFYRKNGYEDAGWIKDYQYGKDNSAAFLLKSL